jgi:hypothetical protein
MCVDIYVYTYIPWKGKLNRRTEENDRDVHDVSGRCGCGCGVVLVWVQEFAAMTEAQSNERRAEEEEALTRHGKPREHVTVVRHSLRLLDTSPNSSLCLTDLK